MIDNLFQEEHKRIKNLFDMYDAEQIDREQVVIKLFDVFIKVINRKV